MEEGGALEDALEGFEWGDGFEFTLELGAVDGVGVLEFEGTEIPIVVSKGIFGFKKESFLTGGFPKHDALWDAVFVDGSDEGLSYVMCIHGLIL